MICRSGADGRNVSASRALVDGDVGDQARRSPVTMIGAKVVSRGRYVTFQMAEVAVSRQMFAEVLSLIARLRSPPAPA
jgi:hypothetical protein